MDFHFEKFLMDYSEVKVIQQRVRETFVPHFNLRFYLEILDIFFLKVI